MASREKSGSKRSKQSRRGKRKSVRAQRKTERCTGDKMCECGCGQAVKPGRRYVFNHHRKNWKGGTSFHPSNKYLRVWCPKHPRASTNGYVYEHILIAEKALGRFIPAKHPIHHAGKNRLDNTKLVICENEEYHQLLHKRTEEYLARKAKGQERSDDDYDIVDWMIEREQLKRNRNA
jgi:hypothetical protein